MKPKIIILISLSVVIILTLAISFSYAIWISNNQQTGENIVKSGCLEITYEEDANSVISIENGYPISDEAGLETTPYTFKIKNTCSLHTEYNVNAEVLNTTTLNHEFLRVTLDNESSDIINNYQLIEETIENAISYNLNTFELAPEEERIHSFRMWIDKDTTTTDGNNKLINLSITISAIVKIEPYVAFTQDFGYTGDSQELIVPYTGLYKIELWGAQGGSNIGLQYNYAGINGGSGGYVSGIIRFTKNDSLIIYVGGKGKGSTGWMQASTSGYNGGGTSGYEGNCYNNSTCIAGAAGGGGSTDIRFNSDNINSRILVASAGGGAGNWAEPKKGSSAGGLIGYNGTTHNSNNEIAVGASQTSGGYRGGGPFGYGTSGNLGYGGNSSNTYGGGGGSGYYGGGGAGGASGSVGSGASGSSFISGHTGAVAITSETDQTPKEGCTTGTTDNACSIHYSDKIFTDTIMIDGAGYSWTNIKGALQQMPNPSGGFYNLGVGHTGNGYARITRIEN